MAEKEMLRVIAYDVSSDKKRNRISDILEDFGVRVQRSVFEARLTHEQANQVMKSIRPHLDKGDTVRLYTVPDPMVERCSSVGGPPIEDAGRFWLL